jgi:hypothetical protein
MNAFDSASYGPVFAPLLNGDRRRTLDAGTKDRDALSALNKLTVEVVFARAGLRNRDMAACCIAGVWLLHDYLAESHAISQGVETQTGSFWHAIAHRREGDFSNAKYWFRHVGPHPIFEMLMMRAGELAAEHGETNAGTSITAGNKWEPFAFVDLCQTAQHGRSELRDLCLDIQQVEWELLFDFCYFAAIEP